MPQDHKHMMRFQGKSPFVNLLPGEFYYHDSQYIPRALKGFWFTCEDPLCDFRVQIQDWKYDEMFRRNHATAPTSIEGHV